MSKNAFWDAINGYESTVSDRRADTGKRFFVRSFSGSVTKKKQKITDLAPVRFMEWLSRIISYTSTKAYGAALLSFGLMSVIFHFTKDYFNLTSTVSTMELTVGIICAVISIPLLLVDRPFCIALQDFAPTDFLFYEFLCINRKHRIKKYGSIPTALAIVIGIIPSVFAIFFPMESVIFVLISIITVYVCFSSPECSLILSLLILPYASYLPNSDFIVPAIIIVTLLSFLRKVIYGKRVLHIEQYDVFITLMMIMILISGIFIKGIDSFTNSLDVIILMVGYTLCSNLITNRRLADRVVSAIIISSVPAAISAIVDFAYISDKALVLLKHGVSGFFNSPSELAIFLSVILTVTLAQIKQSRGNARALYFFILIFLIDLVALVLTAQRFATIVLVLGFLAHFAYKVKYLAPILILLILSLPYLTMLLPDDIKTKVFLIFGGIFSKTDLTGVWTSAFDLFLKNPLVGIGIGASSFLEEMPWYGASSITNSHNLFLEIALEAGVFALACFIILLVIRLRHRSAYQQYLKNSQVATLSPIITVATLVMILLGTSSYIWSDVSTTYLFWSVFGIGSATLRIAKREYDDRVLYFDGERSASSSVIDIEIS